MTYQETIDTIFTKEEQEELKTEEKETGIKVFYINIDTEDKKSPVLDAASLKIKNSIYSLAKQGNKYCLRILLRLQGSLPTYPVTHYYSGDKENTYHNCVWLQSHNYPIASIENVDDLDTSPKDRSLETLWLEVNKEENNSNWTRFVALLSDISVDNLLTIRECFQEVARIYYLLSTHKMLRNDRGDRKYGRVGYSYVLEESGFMEGDSWYIRDVCKGVAMMWEELKNQSIEPDFDENTRMSELLRHLNREFKKIKKYKKNS